MGIGKILSDLLIEKQTNAKAVAEQAGVTPSTIYSIIKRDNSKVDIDTLIKICKVLDVSIERFYDEYYDKTPFPTLSQREQDLVSAYRLLDDRQKDVIDYQIRTFAEFNEYKLNEK